MAKRQKASAKPAAKCSRKEATTKTRETIRRLMSECDGSEWQRLNAFNTVLTNELARILERMEKLRPDEWGM